MNGKRYILIVMAVLIVIGAGLIIYQKKFGGIGGSADKTAYITVTAAPSDSKVTLNNKSGQLGLNTVAPGNYSVTISRDGFASVTKNVTAVKGQDTPVAFALTPDRADTANWYLTHSQDATTAQNITNSQYSSVANYKATQPISSILPYTAGGFEFTIAEDPDSDDVNNPLIYIEADTPSAQQDALTWIKNQGYDPSKLNLKYSTTTDPSRP